MIKCPLWLLAIFDVDWLLNADELEQIRQLIRQLAIVLPELKKVIPLNRDAIARDADLSELSRGVYTNLLQFIDQYEEFSIGIIRELDDLTKAVKEMQRLVILEKTGLSQTTEARKIRADIQTDQDRDYLTTELATQQKLLQTRSKTLSKLTNQAAQYGGYDFAPIELQNRIETSQMDVEQSKSAIEHIKAELRGL